MIQQLLPARRAQHGTTSLWPLPVASGALAFVAMLLLLRVRPSPESAWARWAWPGDSESGMTMVQLVAGSVITVTSLTFSLTVLALQLASQQFSPRLLREFSRDTVTKATLAILVSTFVAALTALRGLAADTRVPAPALLAVFVLGLASLAAVLGFITHFVRLVRVDTMMLTAHDETDKAIAQFYPLIDDQGPQALRPQDLDPTGTHLVLARTSGLVRMVNVRRLVADAAAADLVVNVLSRPGDLVVRGTPVATVRPASEGTILDPEAGDDLVHSSL